MIDEQKIDKFILLLRHTYEKKSNQENRNIRTRLKIRDRIISVIFVLDYKDLSILETKDGVTTIYPQFPDEGEPELCTLKHFLIDEIRNENITIVELEQFIFEIM